MNEQEQELNELQYAILREFKDSTKTKLDEFDLLWVDKEMFFHEDFHESVDDLVKRGYLKEWKRRGVKYYRRL